MTPSTQHPIARPLRPHARRVFGRLRKVLGEGDGARVFVFELTRAGLVVRPKFGRRAKAKLVGFDKLAQVCSVGQIEFKL